jgi:hypothetical protein
MASLPLAYVPAIHVFLAACFKDVDARHKAGHDDIGYQEPFPPATAYFAFAFARAMPSAITLCASSAPPHLNTFTHLPGSRSL